MNLDDLEKSIIDWAGSRGIFAGSTPNSQMLKTMEEVGETARAVLKKDLPEIKDGIGDIVVTLIIQAHFQGLSLRECVESAYNTISQRTGRMVNGSFVKDD